MTELGNIDTKMKLGVCWWLEYLRLQLKSTNPSLLLLAVACDLSELDNMVVKLRSVIQHDIVAPKNMHNRLNLNQNYTFMGGWGMAGLIVNKANLSKAELAAGCC